MSKKNQKNQAVAAVIESPVIVEEMAPVSESVEPTGIVEESATTEATEVATESPQESVIVLPGDDLQAKVAEFKRLKAERKKLADEIKVASKAAKDAKDAAKAAGKSTNYTRIMAAVDSAKLGGTFDQIVKAADKKYHDLNPTKESMGQEQEAKSNVRKTLDAMYHLGILGFDAETKIYSLIPYTVTK